MVTNSGLVYLIALPLFGAVSLLLLGRRADKWGHLLATALSAGSFAVGLFQLSQMLGRDVESRPVTQKLFTWISVGSFNVDASLLLDQLSISFVLLITGVGTLIQWNGSPVHWFKELGFTVSLPKTDNLFRRCIMLPMNAMLTNSEVEIVVDTVQRFYGQS